MADPKVRLIAPSTGKVQELDAPDAQEAFVAGRGNLVDGDQHDLIAPDGTIAKFASNRVPDAVREGWGFATPDDLGRYDAQRAPVQSFLEGVADPLTLSASRFAYGDGANYRADTAAGTAGNVLGNAIAILGTGGLGGFAEGAAALSAKGLMANAAKLALAPTELVNAGTAAVSKAAGTALADWGASKAAARLGGEALGAAAAGTGIGAMQGFTEEALGNPDANAESLWAATGGGALIGGALGGGLGATGATIGHLMEGRALRGKAALATMSPEELATTLGTQGLDLEPSNGWLHKFTKAAAESLGADGQQIDLLSSKGGKAILRDRERAVANAARELDRTVKYVAQVQEEVGQDVGRLKPQAVKDLIGTASGGQAISAAGTAVDAIRAELAQLEEVAAAKGLGEGVVASKLKKQVQAVDAFEERMFKTADVPRAYQEHTVYEPEDLGPGFLRKEPAARTPEPGLPVAAAPDLSKPPAIQRELPGVMGDQGNDALPGLRPDPNDPRKAKYVVAGLDSTPIAQVRTLAKDADKLVAAQAGDVREAADYWSGSGYDAIRANQGGHATRYTPGENAAVDAEATRAGELIDAAARSDQALQVPVAWRGIAATNKETLRKILTADTISDPALSSWTYSPHVAHTFATNSSNGGAPVVFRMRDARGLPVSGGEHELIMPRGQNFKVVGTSLDELGRYNVLLEPAAASGAGATVPGAAAGKQLTFDELGERLTVPRKVQLPVAHGPVPEPAADANAFGSLGGSKRTATATKQWTLKELGERFVLPDRAGAETFDALQQLRRAFAKLPKTADEDVTAAVARIQGHLDHALTDKGAFNGAAEMHEKLTAAFADRDAAYAALKGQYKLDDAGAAKRYMDNLTNLKGDATKAALDRWVSANQAAGEIADQYFPSSGFGAKARAAAADFAKTGNGMRDTVQVLNALTGLTKHERTVAWASGGALQYGLAHAMGAVTGVGGVPGTLLAAAVGSKILHPGTTAVSLAKLGGVVDKVRAHVDALAQRAITATGNKAVELAPRTVGVATRAMLEAKSREGRLEAYNERRAQLEALADQATFLDHTQRAYGDLATAAPQHTAALTRAAQAALQTVLGSVPAQQTGTGGLAGPPSAPSDADLLRFAMTDRAAQDPLGTLQAAIDRGMMLPAERAALEATAPRLLEQFRASVSDHATPGSMQARQVRLLSSILGRPSPVTAWAQGAHQGPAKTPGPAGAPPTPGPHTSSHLKAASAVLASEADRLGAGRNP